MAGGDLHVRVGASYAKFGLNSVIDAHSTPSGSMTTPVDVGGRQVFMTREGAEALELLREGDFRFAVHADTRRERCAIALWRTCESDNVPQAMPEKHVGSR